MVEAAPRARQWGRKLPSFSHVAHRLPDEVDGLVILRGVARVFPHLVVRLSVEATSTKTQAGLPMATGRDRFSASFTTGLIDSEAASAILPLGRNTVPREYEPCTQKKTEQGKGKKSQVTQDQSCLARWWACGKVGS